MSNILPNDTNQNYNDDMTDMIEKQEKKNLFQKIINMIIMLSTKLSEFSKLSSYYVPVSKYIVLEPTIETSLQYKGTVSSVKSQHLIGKLSTNSFKYKLLLIMLNMMFYVLPLVIFLMSFIYLFPILNISQIVKEKKFYNDLIIYREIDKIYNIFGVYVNDYILYFGIVCIIFLIVLIYIYFNKFVTKTEASYLEFKQKIYFIFITSFVTIILHFMYYYDKTQRIGQLRDRLINITSHNINKDYILFLEQEYPNKTDLLDMNTTDGLFKYISGLLVELKTQAAPSDIKLMTTEQFKNFKNDKGEPYYDLILHAIVTYSLIVNIANNKYNEGDVKAVDKNFFLNEKSFLLTVNYNKNNLLEINSKKCIDRILDDNDNTSAFMTSICNDCRQINQDINDCLIDLKNVINNFIFPPQIVTAFFIFIYGIIYYYTFLTQVRIFHENTVDPNTMNNNYTN